MYKAYKKAYKREHPIDMTPMPIFGYERRSKKSAQGQVEYLGFTIPCRVVLLLAVEIPAADFVGKCQMAQSAET